MGSRATKGLLVLAVLMVAQWGLADTNQVQQAPFTVENAGTTTFENVTTMTFAAGSEANMGPAILEIPNSQASGAGRVGGDCGSAAQTGRVFVDLAEADGEEFFYCNGTVWTQVVGGGAGAGQWDDDEVGGTVLRPGDATDDWIRIAGDPNAPKIGDPNSTQEFLFDADDDEVAEMLLDSSGNLTITGTMSQARTATPAVQFGDVNTTDSDINAQIQVNCDTTGSGAEDCDIDIRQQIDGAEEIIFFADAETYDVYIGDDTATDKVVIRAPAGGGIVEIQTGASGDAALVLPVGGVGKFDIDFTNITHDLINNSDLGDDHLQYAKLQGRSGGQTIAGGTAASDDLTLSSTSHGTPGTYIFDDLVGCNNGIQTDGSGVMSCRPDVCFSEVLPNDPNAERYLWSYHTAAFTVSEINCIVDPTGTTETINLALYEADATGDFTSLAANGLDGATTITCDVDGATDDGDLSNPSIAADRWIGLDTTAGTGTPVKVSVTYCGSYD